MNCHQKAVTQTKKKNGIYKKSSFHSKRRLEHSSAAIFPRKTSPFVSENVALQKPCDLSTVYTGDQFSTPCGAAINGNTSTTYQAGNCIHTDRGDQHPEWTVYLGQDYTIQSITIYARGESLHGAV